MGKVEKDKDFVFVQAIKIVIQEATQKQSNKRTRRFRKRKEANCCGKRSRGY